MVYSTFTFDMCTDPVVPVYTGDERYGTLQGKEELMITDCPVHLLSIGKCLVVYGSDGETLDGTITQIKDIMSGYTHIKLITISSKKHCSLTRAQIPQLSNITSLSEKVKPIAIVMICIIFWWCFADILDKLIR